MKFLISLIVICAVVVALAVGAVEGSYYYQINKLKPEKQLSDTDYSKQLQEIMWVTSSETGEIGMDPLSATSFVYRTFSSFGSEEKGPGLQGSFVAANLAENMLDNELQVDSSGDDRMVQSGLLSVWVTKNYSATEAMNASIDRVYLGNETYGADNAAKLYFNKSADSLDLSENLVLGVFSYLPDSVTVCGDGAQLAEHAKSLLELMKMNFPARYQDSQFALPEFSEAVKASCN
jgi:membrane carboxypeptidase/penicillin-binding protein